MGLLPNPGIRRARFENRLLIPTHVQSSIPTSTFPPHSSGVMDDALLQRIRGNDEMERPRRRLSSLQGFLKEVVHLGYAGRDTEIDRSAANVDNESSEDVRVDL